MAMAARYYERLLGLPADVVTPDYFQLLGLERDSEVDEEQLVDVLAERLDRLEAAPATERSIVQHLTRELQRARATLLDPRGCAGHLQEMKQRRLREVPKYVEALLDDQRALSEAAEGALLERAPAWDLSPGELTRAIDRALLMRQATRTRRPEALAGAEERVLAVMRKIADDQLRVDAGLTANNEATPRRRKREPVNDAGAPEPPAGAAHTSSAGAGEVTVESESESSNEEARHWSPARPPAAAPEPSATPWAPVAASADGRAARRWQRTYLALGVMALAFIVGDLAAAFSPVETTWLDARTAPARARLWASPNLVHYAAGGAATALGLFGLMIWLAGRPERRPFAIPLAALALPLAYAGLVPVGHERAVLRERDALAQDRDVLVLQTRAVSEVRDAALRREASTIALVTTLSRARSRLEQQLADREQQLADRERQLADRAERVTRLERSVRLHDEALRRSRQEAVRLRGEIAAIRSTTSAGRGDAPSLTAPVAAPPAASVAPAASGARR